MSILPGQRRERPERIRDDAAGGRARGVAAAGPALPAASRCFPDQRDNREKAHISLQLRFYEFDDVDTIRQVLADTTDGYLGTFAMCDLVAVAHDRIYGISSSPAVFVEKYLEAVSPYRVETFRCFYKSACFRIGNAVQFGHGEFRHLWAGSAFHEFTVCLSEGVFQEPGRQHAQISSPMTGELDVTAGGHVRAVQQRLQRVELPCKFPVAHLTGLRSDRRLFSCVS